MVKERTDNPAGKKARKKKQVTTVGASYGNDGSTGKKHLTVPVPGRDGSTTPVQFAPAAPTPSRSPAPAPQQGYVERRVTNKTPFYQPKPKKAVAEGVLKNSGIQHSRKATEDNILQNAKEGGLAWYIQAGRDIKTIKGKIKELRKPCVEGFMQDQIARMQEDTTRNYFGPQASVKLRGSVSRLHKREHQVYEPATERMKCVYGMILVKPPNVEPWAECRRCWEIVEKETKKDSLEYWRAEYQRRNGKPEWG